MARFDKETLLFNALAILRANINTKIAEINAEKNDGLTLDLIPDNDKAYMAENLNNRSANFKVFVVYFIDSPGDLSDNNFNNSIESVKFTFEIVFFDRGKDSDLQTLKKQLRYARCLKDLFHKNYDKIHSGVKFKVTEELPVSFPLDGKILRSSGVSITAAITSN